MLIQRVLVTFVLLAAIPLPLFAQDMPMPQPVPIEIVGQAQVSHNGIRFSFDAGLVDAVSVAQIAASNDTLPVPSPGYTEFTLDGFSESVGLGSAGLPRISIYAVEDFEVYPEYAEQLTLMNRLLTQRPDLNRYATALPFTLDAPWLPFAPVLPAVQAMRVFPQYIEVDGIRGVRYLVYYLYGTSSIAEGELFYTFQGITDDGQHYVSMLMPVNTGLLPADAAPPANRNEWISGYGDDLLEVLSSLTASGGAGFSPSLATLDAIAQSVTINQ